MPCKDRKSGVTSIYLRENDTALLNAVRAELTASFEQSGLRPPNFAEVMRFGLQCAAMQTLPPDHPQRVALVTKMDAARAMQAA